MGKKSPQLSPSYSAACKAQKRPDHHYGNLTFIAKRHIVSLGAYRLKSLGAYYLILSICQRTLETVLETDFDGKNTTVGKLWRLLWSGVASTHNPQGMNQLLTKKKKLTTSSSSSLGIVHASMALPLFIISDGKYKY